MHTSEAVPSPALRPETDSAQKNCLARVLGFRDIVLLIIAKPNPDA